MLKFVYMYIFIVGVSSFADKAVSTKNIDHNGSSRKKAPRISRNDYDLLRKEISSLPPDIGTRLTSLFNQVKDSGCLEANLSIEQSAQQPTQQIQPKEDFPRKVRDAMTTLLEATDKYPTHTAEWMNLQDTLRKSMDYANQLEQKFKDSKSKR